MKRFHLVLLLAVAGLAVARDTVDDMVKITSRDTSPAVATGSGETAAPAVTVVILDPDFLETYATELPYPFLLNPREAVALSGDWMEGDPYYYEDLFGGRLVRAVIAIESATPAPAANPSAIAGAGATPGPVTVHVGQFDCRLTAD